jgi:hypothetical protein
MTSYSRLGLKPKVRYTEPELLELERATENLIKLTATAEQVARDIELEREIIGRIAAKKVTPDNKVVAPGITLASVTKVEIDREAALKYLLTPDESGQYVNLYTAGGMITVNPDAMGVLAAQVIANPALKGVLALDYNGYKSAIIKGTHKDAPYIRREVVSSLSIEVGSLKTGADLRSLVEVVREES